MSSYEFLAKSYDELTTDVRYALWADYLEKLFRQQVGMSLGQYIDDQLMGTAQWWLEQTGRRQEDCGFYDPANSCWFPPVEG